MNDTWRLRKITETAIYVQEHLTMNEVLSEVFSMVSYSHHGFLKYFSCNTDKYVISYVYVFDFGGDVVIYIFEREVEDNEKDTVINSD